MKRPEAIRALLVEDSRPMRILVREMLRALGITYCECAASADEAIEVLHMFTPDLVITNLRARMASVSPGVFAPGKTALSRASRL